MNLKHKFRFTGSVGRSDPAETLYVCTLPHPGIQLIEEYLVKEGPAFLQGPWAEDIGENMMSCVFVMSRYH